MRTYLRVRGARAEEVQGVVVAELPLTIHVNGRRLVTLLCSPFDLDALVVGHLWMEGLIGRIDDVRRLEASEVDGRADVELRRRDDGLDPRAVGGRPAPALHSPLRVGADAICARIADLAAAATHYRESRGIHAAGLSDGARLLIVAEDVSRRNAIDRVKGRALLGDVPTADRILVSSGRISSEMLLRAARMGCPVVASRTSPTDMAIALAEQLNVTVCGYVQPDRLTLYTGDALLVPPLPVHAGAGAPGPLPSPTSEQ